MFQMNSGSSCMVSVSYSETDSSFLHWLKENIKDISVSGKVSLKELFYVDGSSCIKTIPYSLTIQSLKMNFLDAKQVTIPSAASILFLECNNLSEYDETIKRRIVYELQDLYPSECIFILLSPLKDATFKYVLDRVFVDCKSFSNFRDCLFWPADINRVRSHVANIIFSNTAAKIRSLHEMASRIDYTTSGDFLSYYRIQIEIAHMFYQYGDIEKEIETYKSLLKITEEHFSYEEYIIYFISDTPEDMDSNDYIFDKISIPSITFSLVRLLFQRLIKICSFKQAITIFLDHIENLFSMCSKRTLLDWIYRNSLIAIKMIPLDQLDILIEIFRITSIARSSISTIEDNIKILKVLLDRSIGLTSFENFVIIELSDFYMKKKDYLNAFSILKKISKKDLPESITYNIHKKMLFITYILKEYNKYVNYSIENENDYPMETTRFLKVCETFQDISTYETPIRFTFDEMNIRLESGFFAYFDTASILLVKKDRDGQPFYVYIDDIYNSSGILFNPEKVSNEDGYTGLYPGEYTIQEIIFSIQKVDIISFPKELYHIKVFPRKEDDKIYLKIPEAINISNPVASISFVDLKNHEVLFNGESFTISEDEYIVPLSLEQDSPWSTFNIDVLNIAEKSKYFYCLQYTFPSITMDIKSILKKEDTFIVATLTSLVAITVISLSLLGENINLKNRHSEHIIPKETELRSFFIIPNSKNINLFNIEVLVSLNGRKSKVLRSSYLQDGFFI
eukprot:GHVP01000405.1.p1 GENE.GHVP01000405.1~~GHVP01000405.1.p1  ORF type:complete len:738 (+),score=94.60 GHVP01000405.1:1453-3666(+)